jgi:hypothetical protein
MLLCGNRYCPADCFGEAQLDLRFDVGANGAESFGLELGKLLADAADLFGGSPIEETQTHVADAGRQQSGELACCIGERWSCWDSLTNQWVK